MNGLFIPYTYYVFPFLDRSTTHRTANFPNFESLRSSKGPGRACIIGCGSFPDNPGMDKRNNANP